MRCQNRVENASRQLNGFVREVVPLLHLRMVLVHSFVVLLLLFPLDRAVVVGACFHRPVHMRRIHGFLRGGRSARGIQV